MSAAPLELTARRYGEQLLRELGCAPQLPLSLAPEHPALTAALSGLMQLTGTNDGPAQLCPLPLSACADGALAALASLSDAEALRGLRGSALLTERAALLGLARAGSICPGGSCRLLLAADGHIALNLARADDWELLPAWLECELAKDWSALSAALKDRPVASLIERGRWLGLAVAADARPADATPPWLSRVYSVTPSRQRAGATGRAPLVVDLSSLWAGPLCAHLLQKMGAQVIKVESIQRPDGARAGSSAFFDLLNAGKRAVAIDGSSAQGRDQLRALLARADIVIEASRPRALRQLGIHAEALIDENPGLTWLAISGYGRGEPQEHAVAFGDDAAVAAGLSTRQYEATGQRVFVGDAMADPMTGIHAALAAWSCWLQGGGQLLSIAMVSVMRHVMAFETPASATALAQRCQQWTADLHTMAAQPAQPQTRAGSAAAAELGADTSAVFKALGIAC